MNDELYSYLTKDIINNYEHNGSLPENCFCPVCNVHMNRIKKSRLHDEHQEYNSLSPDGIKERQDLDRLQTIKTNFHFTINHSDRLLKLNPYPILDTDPALGGLNFSNKLYRSPHVISKNIINNLLT